MDYSKSGKGGAKTGTKVRKSAENAGGKFPMGGDTPMHGLQHAAPMEPSVTAGKKGAGEKYFLKGGAGKMFPKGSAMKMVPGQTGKPHN
jgi:hypothetical protein